MFENVGFKPPKSPKLLIFGINLPQRGIIIIIIIIIILLAA